MPVWATPETYDSYRRELEEMEKLHSVAIIQRDRFLVGRRGACRMYLGDLSGALQDFETAEGTTSVELRAREGAGARSASSAEVLATLNLLLGNVPAAEAVLSVAVEGLRARRVVYADLPGGVSPGLLLWYVGVYKADVALQRRALEYMQLILQRYRRDEYWPAQLVPLIAGECTFDEMLARAMKTSDRAELNRRSSDEALPDGGTLQRANAPTGQLLRRWLAAALFYGGLIAKQKNAPEAERMLLQCTRLQGVEIEDEWYLAFLELGLVKPGALR